MPGELSAQPLSSRISAMHTARMKPAVRRHAHFSGAAGVVAPVHSSPASIQHSWLQGLIHQAIKRFCPWLVLKPDLMVKDVTAISPAWLKARGIKGLIFDLDDTLIPLNKGVLADGIKQKLKSLQKAGVHCIVVTNNRNKDYIAKMQTLVGLPVIGPAIKPLSRDFMVALDRIKLKPKQVAVVGDYALVDVLGAKWLGATSIMVQSLSKDTENGLMRLFRKFQESFLAPESV